ncbi:hypothetical protein [Nonomuraea rubra]|uniref:Uncharacterized protein n=1 Tax=Nonomuraea rubra TaxID=46180 RepID=A0A7X0U1K4_9ACTN|nr:hypothetical protein [Nonomuraea rubra]MBB6551852.1 hypothetical protein [Nonomuraea rubra]
MGSSTRSRYRRPAADTAEHPDRPVFVLAHLHTPNNLSTSVRQDGGSTTVNAPPLTYFEMESGVGGDSTPNDAGDNAQTAVVQVRGSVVTIRNYDLRAGRWIDQTWTWDVAKAVEDPEHRFPYYLVPMPRTPWP